MHKLNRKEFLKASGGAAAGILISSFLQPVWGKGRSLDFLNQNKNKEWPELLVLDSQPPIHTKAVRYYIDEFRVSELTDLYARQTNTKPVWRTAVDPHWFEPGEHTLRVEAETPDGNITFKTEKLIVPVAKDPDERLSLTGAWRFSDAADLSEGVAEGATPEAAGIDFDDSKWPAILVPNSLGYVDQKWNKYEGLLGVYRREVDLKAPSGDEQITITLNSCYWSGRVFINGREAGSTRGGYLPARFDITDKVHEGKNVVAVIVDNRFTTMGVFKRLNAFYWNWGGLLQEVYIARNPNVALIDMRAEGNRSGNLRLRLTSVNKTAAQKNDTISIEVYDPSGRKVSGPRSLDIQIPAGGGAVDPIDLKINNPKLWNLDTPHLYTVMVKSAWGTLKERTGFRDVRVSGPDLLINGKKIEGLQGFDRHEDYPGLGRTQPDGLAYQEMKELYDKGFRIFRPAHYPTTPAELDAADELGMLVIEEINVTGLKGAQLATKEVKSFAAQQLTKMIDRDRSHPCIISWSVGNENLTEEEGAEEYVRETIALGRSLDPARLFTHVTMRATRDKTFKYQDIVAQNYYAGWYTKDVNAITKVLDDVQKYAGNKPILLSEYGAEAIIGRQGTGKGTEFYQGYIVDEHNRLLNNRPHFIGKLYWTSTEMWCRPGWTGGNPSPVPPFHVKALQGYYREQNKLGWRVMFSPVRLSFPSGSSAIRKTPFGGEVDIPASESTEIKQAVTIKEVKGKRTKGSLIILPPIGFKPKDYKIPFALEANGTVTLHISLKGKLPANLDTANGYVKAVIDGDTEAQPLLLTLNESKG